jgi:hypothetical protein
MDQMYKAIPSEELVAALFDRLAQGAHWLLIYDNAEEPAGLIG